MKLLDDIKAYAIKADVFMYSDATDTEYKETMYVTIDTETRDKDGNSLNLIIFKNNITKNLRVFDDVFEASEYIDKHFSNSCSCVNPRIVEISMGDLLGVSSFEA